MLDTPVDLEVDGILRLSFTAQPTPKYAHVEFTDAETDSSWTYEVPVKSHGKARFELVSLGDRIARESAAVRQLIQTSTLISSRFRKPRHFPLLFDDLAGP